MRPGPLTRRHLALDEDSAERWAEHELATFVQDMREAEAQRDRRQVERGRRLLAEYMADGMSYRDAFRSFMADLLGPRP